MTLITVDRSYLSIPGGSESWSKMEDMLRASFMSAASGDDADKAATKAIKTLRDKLRTPPKKCCAKTRNLIATFNRIIKGDPILFPGGLHCEGLLATLFKYCELFLKGDDANLLSTCKVLLFTYLPARSDHLS